MIRLRIFLLSWRHYVLVVAAPRLGVLAVVARVVGRGLKTDAASASQLCRFVAIRKARKRINKDAGTAMAGAGCHIMVN